MSIPISELSTNIETLVDVLRWRAVQQPEQDAYTFLLDGEAETVSLSYAALDLHARAVAALLQQQCAPGDRVLLLYPPGLAYLAAFFGCLYAGVIAVPAYPPNPARLARTLPRLRLLATDAQPTVALTTAAVRDAIGAIGAVEPAFAALRWLAVELDTPVANAQDWQPPTLSGATLAFLQYTSGSTAQPRGVMLTHANLLHNSALIKQAFNHTTASHGVIWLPPYHDMGLIGGLIQPLYTGFPVTLLAPVDFLQRPLRWLQAISRFQATTSGGPNFAYDLCVRTITAEQRATLDLRSWRVAFNGAEPVRAATMQRFAETFAPCGFEATAFYPCYGLAEATLIVTGGQVEALPIAHNFAADALGQRQVVEVAAPAGTALVSSGPVLDHQQIAIVDPATQQRCMPSQIGEIWVAGPSVARGYWGQPGTTTQTFNAQIVGEPPTSYVRTGDLGFLAAGELFVTGRQKDVIIIRGRNYYPQDIEQTVESSHPALRAGNGAAFAIEVEGSEQLVVAYELERQQRHTNLEAVTIALRQQVALEHDLAVYAVALLKPGSIPKTSSGKIQRYACRAAYLDGTLDVLGQSVRDEQNADHQRVVLTRELLMAAAPEQRALMASQYLRGLLAERLGVTYSPALHQDSITLLGLDSLQMVEMQHHLERDLGIVIPMAQLLEDPQLSHWEALLLKQLHAEPSTLVVAPNPAASSDAPHPYPLASGQQALWLLHQLASSSAAYHVVSAVRVCGPLDVAAMQQAWQHLVERHPSLGAVFSEHDGEPQQQVAAHPTIAYSYEAVPNVPMADLRAQLAAYAQHPFDLAHDPLVRVRLLQRDADETILLLVVHHLVADLWSMGVIVNELRVLYAAAQTGQVAALPTVRRTYADYVSWQRQMLASAEGERLGAYWQGQLASAPPVLDLPTDRARPPTQSFRGATHTFAFDTTLTQQLKACAQTHEATLYMLVLATFQMLLYRYTGQNDLIVGTPTTGRTRADFASTVGYFVNPVAIRTRLADEQSFAALLAQVRHTVLEALAHQEYPFALLVERVQPERDPSRSPLFQVMFVFQQTHVAGMSALGAFALGIDGPRLQFGDVQVEAFALEQPAAQFDLTLTMAEHAGQLIGALQYNSDLFDAATISRMALHLHALAHQVVVDPAQPVGALTLLTSVERAQLHAWNATAAPYSEHDTIYDLFYAQAQRTPAAIAISTLTAQVRYGELDARVTQLSAYLHALGVGPETRVGVCLARTPDMVVALLATLKAGGAYVPLDPAYPSERLALMLRDAQVRVVLTHTHLRERLPRELANSAPDAAPHVVCLDRDAATIAEAPPVASYPPVDQQNLAYILYTSGSTGVPKGVALTHRNAVAFITWAHQAFTRDQLRGILAATSINFDLSVFELFVPLSCGGTVVLADNVLQVAQFPDTAQITLVNTVPSAMRELLRLGALPSSVATINLAGEPLPLHLVQDIYHQAHVQQVVNLYGPTEVTTYATFTTIARDDPATPAIGRPLTNIQAYVLDRQQELVPVGVVGELYLGGVGLARGYWGQSALTAERFVPDPRGAPGTRMYRTGDLARYRADGQLEFLGRRDHQVKVRGFRIELGEIETALAHYSGVQDVVVVAREDSQGDTRLVAYLVPTAATTQAAAPDAELRAALRKHLPTHMLPSAFVWLAALPLTPNGKLDRRALPAPLSVASTLSSIETAPRSPVEAQLAKIWTAVLGVEQVQTTAHFFEIGGHSLLATRIIARVREVFHVDLPLHRFFETPTIAELARLIESSLASAPRAPAAGIASIPRGAHNLDLMQADVDALRALLDDPL